jgi:small GTP-binding protein|eukprot:gnl/Ergobibamus_cyprinoides/805.p1 GENE.gnl/Ergobibamus_cyprinoides/805~~gnl/Ergobibamus_cyprinoides/805.p1  ORF type:complete len:382 (+),score=150.50 gnl/Ergobibamus_cyprinoides/805:100-1146(+)
MAHLCRLKARVAQLQRDIVAESSRAVGKGGERGFNVSKSGDARVGLIGFPSVGKSTLLNKLTGTESRVAAWTFTTLTAIPGSIHYNGSRIQLLDLPGIIEGAREGKGRGKQVVGTARTCDLILVTLDAAKSMTLKRIVERELGGFGIRLNQRPPNIALTKKDRGGITVTSTVELTHMTKELVEQVCKDMKINNADVTIREDITPEQLIDVIEGNRVYIPCIFVLNKIDQITIEELDLLDKLPNWIPISAHEEWNLDELLEKIFERLALMRVYTKPVGQPPDYDDPIILKCSSGKPHTIEDFCRRIHTSYVDRLKYAVVWGNSVRHPGQRVGLTHELADEDVVQLVLRQ